MAKKMGEDELSAIVAGHLRGSLGDEYDDLTAERADSLARYQGELYGDETLGRSQVMSRDVLEQVEQTMPSLVRTFLGSEPAAIFEPRTPDDEAMADQATKYINYILFSKNDGYTIALDWMKSALITGTSVAKVWWDDRQDVSEEEYSGLTEAEMEQLVSDDTVEVIEHTAFGEMEGAVIVDEQGAMQAALEGKPVEPIHDLKIKRTTNTSQLRWGALAPEEFLINRRARTIDERDHTFTFCCHRSHRTVQSLIDEGFDKDKVESAAGSAGEYNDIFEQRFEDVTADYGYDNEVDSTQRRVNLYECYMRCDYDGSGSEQLHRVTTLGGSSAVVILEVEPVNELPFCQLTAVRRPHRAMGYSLADLTKDLQKLKTALWRGMMDGLYLSLSPHVGVDETKVELDDLLSQSPGSIVRVQGSPQSAIMPIVNQWSASGGQAFPMVQYIDSQLQKRTGVNDLAGSLTEGVLQSETATAVSEATTAARARVELIARNMAEEGWKRLYHLALVFVNRHQDHEEVVRLTGKDWSTVDPRSWTSKMDVRINVGLGVGTKQETVQKLQFISQKQEQLMSQLGIQNPVAGIDKYYNTLVKLAEAAELDPSLYFNDPQQALEAQKGQPQQPSPEMQKMQAEMQMKQADNQARLQQTEVEMQRTAELEKFKAELTAQNDIRVAEMKAQAARQIAEQKLELDKEIEANRHIFKMRELEMERDLEAEKMRLGVPSRDGQGNINVSD